MRFKKKEKVLAMIHAYYSLEMADVPNFEGAEETYENAMCFIESEIKKITGICFSEFPVTTDELLPFLDNI
tara:strand:+ start:33 stop:245 length:213 start_codon:yes stop_codon:yes gene_type:complete